MPYCLAFGCKSKSGKSKPKKKYYTIPDPLKDPKKCARSLHNFGNARLNINNFVSAKLLKTSKYIFNFFPTFPMNEQLYNKKSIDEEIYVPKSKRSFYNRNNRK